MTTVTLNNSLSRWVNERSSELGMTPDELVADVLARRQAAEEFTVLTDSISAEARERGLTDDTLAELLDGETYD